MIYMLAIQNVHKIFNIIKFLICTKYFVKDICLLFSSYKMMTFIKKHNHKKNLYSSIALTRIVNKIYEKKKKKHQTCYGKFATYKYTFNFPFHSQFLFIY